VSAPLALCRNGVHACRVEQLPHWLGPELWVVQLDGQVVEFDDVLVSSRARLVESVQWWSSEGRAAFARDCARQAHDMTEWGLGADELVDVDDCAEKGDAAAAGYLTAGLAGGLAAEGGRAGPRYDRGFFAERARQARWLAERVGMPDEAAGQRDR
jgi:hypothetical protein